MSLNGGWEYRPIELRPRVRVFMNAAAAVAVAKSKGTILGINAEARRLASEHPDHVSLVDLSEYMIRLAVRQRVSIEIG
jgi:hypothetical protein